jgi:hypothetical protein
LLAIANRAMSGDTLEPRSAAPTMNVPAMVPTAGEMIAPAHVTRAQTAGAPSAWRSLSHRPEKNGK